ncbi:Caulimovirus viroplasmin-domain-containing protein [Bombardia bombarda]|uniref:Ribonuclease H n=1 Tax=Bombardia bombarda TaxID=252184 RepID=A0AA39XBX4_9PEZI|nr:Caulimovirus viroplasmin-domain-containing protein [Bombardia bombarda]
MPKKDYTWYAVAEGRKTGVYDSWSETKPQVIGFKGNCYKGFYSREKAEEFVRRGINSSQSSNSDREQSPNNMQVQPAQPRADASTQKIEIGTSKLTGATATTRGRWTSTQDVDDLANKMKTCRIGYF